jgi:hypothetical protein
MFPDTAIYAYDIRGHGRFHADPLALRRGLLAATDGRCWQLAREAGDLERALGQAADEPGEAGDARRAEGSTRLAAVEGRLVEAARAVFGLPAVDPKTGYGVTEMESLKLLRAFLDWLEQKKSESATCASASS